MPLPLELKAHAKVNLFLNLLGQRPDGYHDVRMVMQRLELADTLTLSAGTSGLQFSCSDAALNTPDNLVVKAYDLYHQQAGLAPIPLSVHLEKHIPVQAGLGGGSSDAAAMLQGLNQLHHQAVSTEQLETMAAQLGSDVPFFLTGGTCLATGRGEVIKPLPPLPGFQIVVIKPQTFGISTVEAYQKAREWGKYSAKIFSSWDIYLQQPHRDIQSLSRLLFNDFETILFPHYPEVAYLKEIMYKMGLAGALMSGSGPAIFGLLDNPEEQWSLIETLFPATDWQVLRTRFC